MEEGSLIALIGIGFRTTDIVVVEIKANGSFTPKAKHRDIRQAFKIKTGGADLNEFHKNLQCSSQ